MTTSAKPFTHPAFSLKVIQVATPCSADWNAMTGDAQVRHCGDCKKNVYNLSAMTESEALALIRAKNGHLCIRFFQRPDGTMLTQDCPVGVRAKLHAAWAGLAARVAAVAVLAVGFFSFGCTARNAAGASTGTGGSTSGVASAIGLEPAQPIPPLTAGQPAVAMGKFTMGDYAPPPVAPYPAPVVPAPAPAPAPNTPPASE